MRSESPQVHRVERVDDIPVLLATLQRLKVDAILDRHFPSGHRWKGELTFGEVACVWIAFITSQGDHRLNQVQPWALDNLHTLKACLATLDPLGLPVTTLVVPGNCADDPLYVPEIRKVQQAFGPGGKTFVCDCKAAALGTRAYLASTDDYYLCPLPETQISADQRRLL